MPTLRDKFFEPKNISFSELGFFANALGKRFTNLLALLFLAPHETSSEAKNLMCI